jgi:Uma2 family endonuclease
MDAATKLMTADELLAVPDDGQRHELVEGEVRTMSPAGADHGDVTLLIASHLLTYVRPRRAGKVYSSDTGFVLTSNPDTVRCPDVGFVRAERVVRTTKAFPGPPDLAVEVVSPSDRYSDVEEKVFDYLAAGTLVVIVVDPQLRVARIHTISGARYVPADGSLDAGDVVPGWSLPLSELFA